MFENNRTTDWFYRLMTLLVIGICTVPGCSPTSVPSVAEAYSASNAITIREPDVSQITRMAGCSAATCHGGTRKELPESASAFITWYESDPHKRAATTLLGQESKEIGNILGETFLGSQDVYNSQRCLPCHSLPSASNSPVSRLILSEGVSCESCHGSAHKWIDIHHERNWHSLTTVERSALGFQDLKDPFELATSCVGCHVGSKRAQVTHDMIAAGHPVLRFELTGYLRRLSPHWNELKLRKSIENIELLRWRAGQLATVLAELELLQTQAAAFSRQQNDSSWPEFANYDCFGCHHDLYVGGWRGQPTVMTQPPSTPRWATWSFPMLMTIVETGDFFPQSAQVLKRLERVRKLMDERIVPDAEMVFREASELNEAVLDLMTLYRHSSNGSVDPELVLKLVAGLFPENDLSPRTRNVVADWNVAAQAYLALEAFHENYRDREMEPEQELCETNQIIEEGLEQIRQLLGFPMNYDSPKDAYIEEQNVVPRSMSATAALMKVAKAMRDRHHYSQNPSPSVPPTVKN